MGPESWPSVFILLCFCFHVSLLLVENQPYNTPVLKLSATLPSLCKADSVCLRHQSKGVTPSTYRIPKGIIALSEHIDFHHKSDETKFTHIKQGNFSLACRQQGNRNRTTANKPNRVKKIARGFSSMRVVLQLQSGILQAFCLEFSTQRE